MLPSEARVAVRLAIKSTSAEIVSAIQADKAAFIRVRVVSSPEHLAEPAGVKQDSLPSVTCW